MVEFVKDMYRDLVLSPNLQYPHVVREDGVTCTKVAQISLGGTEPGVTRKVRYLGDEGALRECRQLVWLPMACGACLTDSVKEKLNVVAELSHVSKGEFVIQDSVGYSCPVGQLQCPQSPSQ